MADNNDTTGTKATASQLILVNPADLPRRKELEGVSFPGCDDAGLYAVSYEDVLNDFKKQMGDTIAGVTFVVDENGHIQVSGGGTAGTAQTTSSITNDDIDAICSDGSGGSKTAASLSKATNDLLGL